MNKIKINTLVVHIGSHKTGTTYVQKYFKENEFVKNNKTFLYPKSGCGLLFGHHEIFNALKNDHNQIKCIFKALSDEVLESHDTIFLSSENFEYLNKDEIECLINQFDFEQIKIIYLYRAWTPLLFAMWQEEIKHGSNIGYENYCLRHIGFPMSSILLNYSLTVNNYEDVVGRNNIAIASFEALANTNLVDFILKEIGTDIPSNRGKWEKINSSFDPFLVEIIRIMNEFSLKEGYPRSYLPKHMYINKACSGQDGFNRDQRIREAMRPYLFQAYDFSQSFSFKQVYKNFFNKYSECFVDGINDIQTIFEQKFEPSSFVTSGYLLNYEVLRDLTSAWLITKNEMNGFRPA